MSEWHVECHDRRHPIFQLTLSWCPVDLSYQLSSIHTDAHCTVLATYHTDLGPFDGLEEVLAASSHDILRWLGVEQERRSQQRE